MKSWRQQGEAVLMACTQAPHAGSFCMPTPTFGLLPPQLHGGSSRILGKHGRCSDPKCSRLILHSNYPSEEKEFSHSPPTFPPLKEIRSKGSHGKIIKLNFDVINSILASSNFTSRNCSSILHVYL